MDTKNVELLPKTNTRDNQYFLIYRNGTVKKIKYSTIYSKLKEYVDYIKFELENSKLYNRLWAYQLTNTWDQMSEKKWGEISGGFEN